MRIDFDSRCKRVPVLWQSAISDWCALLNAAAQSANTIRTRREHLSMVAREVRVASPWDVTFDDLVVWAGGKVWGRSMRRSMYSTLKHFFGWGLGKGFVAVNPAAGLPVVREPIPCPRPVPTDFYVACLRGTTGVVRLILKLAGEAGLRRAEIAQLHARDIGRSDDGWEILVHGKGDKRRLVPISAGFAAELVAHANGGWVFPSPAGGHLTPRWVGDLAVEALNHEYTLHQLRHRFATAVNDGSLDLVAVQLLLGHSSVATTQRYVARGKSSIRAAAVYAQTDL